MAEASDPSSGHLPFHLPTRSYLWRGPSMVTPLYRRLHNIALMPAIRLHSFSQSEWLKHCRSCLPLVSLHGCENVPVRIGFLLAKKVLHPPWAYSPSPGLFLQHYTPLRIFRHEKKHAHVCSTFQPYAYSGATSPPKCLKTTATIIVWYLQC